MAIKTVTILVKARNLATRAIGRVTASMGALKAAQIGVQKASALLNSTFAKLAIGLGGLLVANKVVDVLSKFQTTMAEISTIAAGGQQQVEKLERGILNLSKSVPQDANELGAGAYQILSAGITNMGDTLSVLEASSKAAVAGLTDTETAVDAVTTVINAFQLEASEATRVTDVLFKTVEQGKIRFNEIAGSIGTAATSAGLAGVRVEELAAGIATLTKAGLNANRATTALNRLFLTATKKTTDQEKAFKRLGIEYTTAEIKARGFSNILAEIVEKTDGSIDKLAELFPNIRAARAAFVLAGSGAEEFVRILEELDGAEGSAEAAFLKMNATIVNQVQILKNNLAVVLFEMKDIILPPLTAVVKFLTTALQNTVAAIKILGAEAVVFEADINFVFQSINAAVANFVAQAIQKLLDFVKILENVGSSLSDLPGPAGSLFSLVAGGAGLARKGLDGLSEGANQAVEDFKRARDEADEFRQFAREARDEVAQAAIVQRDAVRTRAGRDGAATGAGGAGGGGPVDEDALGKAQNALLNLDQTLTAIQRKTEAGLLTPMEAAEERANAFGSAIDAVSKTGLSVNETIDAQGRSLLTLARNYQGLQTQIAEAIEAEKEQERVQKLLNKALSLGMTRTEQLTLMKDQLTAMFEAGKIGAEAYQRALANVNKELKKTQEEQSATTDLSNRFASVFAQSFTSAQRSQESFADTFVKSSKKMLQQFAVSKGKEQLAEGLADVAAAIFPPNPAAAAAAAQHFAAAAAFFALAGAAGGGGGRGGGRGGGPGPGFGDRRQRDLAGAGAGSATLIIEGDFLDMNNPQTEERFVDAMESLSGRNVRVRRSR